MTGVEQKKTVEIEAGAACIKRKEEGLPPGWEWVWMEDPWIGEWEGSKDPKAKADYRQRREILPKTLLLGRG